MDTHCDFHTLDARWRAFLTDEHNRAPALRRWHAKLTRTRETLSVLDVSRYRTWQYKLTQLCERLLALASRVQARLDMLADNSLEQQYSLLMLSTVYTSAAPEETFARLVGEFAATRTTAQQQQQQRAHCADCGADEFEYDRSRTLAVCTACGLAQPMFNADGYDGALAYGERPQYRKHVSYKRINHFSEILALRQNKELGRVADTVFEALQRELALWHLDAARCTEADVCALLALCGYLDFRDQAPQLWTRLTGRMPLQLTSAQEHRLRARFSALNDLWDSVPAYLDKGKSFLNYNYVARQLCLLEGYAGFAQRFAVMKGLRTLNRHNRVWEWMCGALGWPFSPVCLLDKYAKATH